MERKADSHFHTLLFSIWMQKGGQRQRDRTVQLDIAATLHTIKAESHQRLVRKSWLFSLRGCSRNRHQEKKKKKTLLHAVIGADQTVWKLARPITVPPGRGPPQVLSWKSVTVLGREHARELLWTSGCMGLSFIWNPKREGENNNRSQQFGVAGWGAGEPKACGQCSVSVGKSTPKGGVELRHIRAFWFRNNTEELTLIWAWHSGHKIPRASWPQEHASWGVKNVHLCFQPREDDTQME